MIEYDLDRCSNCSGKGSTVVPVSIEPTMIEITCERVNGTYDLTSRRIVCNICKGKGIVLYPDLEVERPTTTTEEE